MEKKKHVREQLLRGVAAGLPSVRGAVETILSARRPLRVKYGIDPTAPGLHLGYFAVFRKLRLLQALGHTAVILIGDFTARFGDPTEKTATRALRDAKAVRRAGRVYREQIARYLDPRRTEFRSNSEWYDVMSAEALLRLMSEATVAQMLEREMFRARTRKRLPIGLHEPVYPMLQGYDSVMLRADATVVGQDQLFNERVGRTLQERRGQQPQAILGIALLPGIDGQEKMSQSLGNAVGLNESPEEQYGKLMAIPDSAVLRYAELLTDLPLPLLRRALAQKGVRARNAKARVAQEIVTQIAGAAAAGRAQAEFDAVFRKRELPADIEALRVPAPTDAVSLLVASSIAPSRAQAQRLVRQGGVRIDGVRIENPRARIIIGQKGVLLAVGKRVVRILPRRR